jgi:hypothetical protein
MVDGVTGGSSTASAGLHCSALWDDSSVCKSSGRGRFRYSESHGDVARSGKNAVQNGRCRTGGAPCRLIQLASFLLMTYWPRQADSHTPNHANADKALLSRFRIQTGWALRRAYDRAS